MAAGITFKKRMVYKSHNKLDSCSFSAVVVVVVVLIKFSTYCRISKQYSIINGFPHRVHWFMIPTPGLFIFALLFEE